LLVVFFRKGFILADFNEDSRSPRSDSTQPPPFPATDLPCCVSTNKKAPAQSGARAEASRYHPVSVSSKRKPFFLPFTRATTATTSP